MSRLSTSDKAILFSVYHEFRVSPNPLKWLELTPSVNTAKLCLFEKWDANDGNFTVEEDRQHTEQEKEKDSARRLGSRWVFGKNELDSSNSTQLMQLSLTSTIVHCYTGKFIMRILPAFSFQVAHFCFTSFSEKQWLCSVFRTFPLSLSPLFLRLKKQCYFFFNWRHKALLVSFLGKNPQIEVNLAFPCAENQASL